MTKQRIMVLILHNFCSITKKKQNVKSYSISWYNIILSQTPLFEVFLVPGLDLW